MATNEIKENLTLKQVSTSKKYCHLTFKLVPYCIMISSSKPVLYSYDHSFTSRVTGPLSERIFGLVTGSQGFMNRALGKGSQKISGDIF